MPCQRSYNFIKKKEKACLFIMDKRAMDTSEIDFMLIEFKLDTACSFYKCKKYIKFGNADVTKTYACGLLTYEDKTQQTKKRWMQQSSCIRI